MSNEANERFANELELLQSIYPDQIKIKGRDLNYKTSQANLTLRLPDGYLIEALPEVILASIEGKDFRDGMKAVISSYAIGEEVIDAVLLAFNDLVKAQQDGTQYPMAPEASQQAESRKATVIIWLHHLLNTNKRKQCLAPQSSVAGITKPGYPGVLIYSGSAGAVYEHVNELKGLNWAAFQVRLEREEEWSFGHGSGVIEVENMKDIVADIGEARRELFMESMRMK